MISSDYCPRCLTRTDRLPTPRPVLRIGRIAGFRLSSRSCSWCGWEGLRVVRAASPRSGGAPPRA